MNIKAIIVNYKSIDLTIEAIYSLLYSDVEGTIDIVVIDNSIAEGDYIAKTFTSGVKVITPSVNLGFGRACNLAFEGKSCDAVLLLNPDAKLSSGALLRMQRTLGTSLENGAVGPRIYWDDDRRYQIPPSQPPFMYMIGPLFGANGVICRLVSNIFQRWWRRYAFRICNANIPLSVLSLSGGHVLLRNEAIMHAGGLFDPRFFMYFEDTDLFLRIRKAGYRLVVDPRAEVIHGYNRCGTTEDYVRKDAWMTQSASNFLEKHEPAWLTKAKNYLLSRAPSELSFTPMATFFSSFALAVPKSWQRKWVFELSPNATYIPSMIRFGSGPKMVFDEMDWQRLPPGSYFGRLTRHGQGVRKSILIQWRKS